MRNGALTYYIKYTKEGEDNRYYYKKVNTANPYEVIYENKMRDFVLQKILEVNVDGQMIYVVVEEDEARYAFGEKDTPSNIITRIENGEQFAQDYRDILKDLPLQSVFITATKRIEWDRFSSYIPVSDAKGHEITPDVQINEENLLQSNNIWYIEYKKYGDERLYYKPTFCNDKRFRYDEDVEYYRFVKVAEFEFNNEIYKYVYEKEDMTHKPVKSSVKDEVDMAIDEAIFMIYNKHKQGNHEFNGYTPAYPFNTEDISSVFRKHADYINGQDVLTVTGSGDALIDLFMYGANNVTCFDANGTAKYYAKLKFYAIKSGLSYEEYLTFFMGDVTKGYSILNYEIYKKFCHTLDADTKRFWDSIYEYLGNSGQELKWNEHDILYSIVSEFGTTNCTFENPNSYCNRDNYQIAQKMLANKTSDNIKFIDAPLFDLGNHLGSKKFDYAYLSNIMDFTSTFIPNDNLNERLALFKQFIFTVMANLINESGVIVTAFLKKEYLGSNNDILSKLEDYKEVFSAIENFVVQDLQPYNSKDHIIAFYNKVLDYGSR